MTRCLKCGASATPETADTESPMCWAHGGGDPPEVYDHADFLRDVEGAG